MRSKEVIYICLVFVGLCVPSHGVAQDLDGQWYGVGWDATNEFITSNFAIAFDVVGGSGTADVYVPDLGVFHSFLPVTIVGDAITIGVPAAFGLTGTITGQTMEGDGWQAGVLVATWYLEKDVDAPTTRDLLRAPPVMICRPCFAPATSDTARS